jgi:hypothetical protein
MTAYTFVVTVEQDSRRTDAPVRLLGEQITATAERLGFRIVPCGWAPDADTIADSVDADEVVVVDLNPARI